MKSIRRTLMIIIIVFLITNNSAAQPAKNREILVEKNLIYSLTQKVDGIIESTLYNTLFLKEYFPSMNYSKVIPVLEQLSNTTQNPSIKYKANLAAMYLKYGDSLGLNPEMIRGDQAAGFKAVADEFNDKLLASF